MERRRYSQHDYRRHEEESEVVGSLFSLGAGGRPMSPKAQLEQDKKLRREIANSNERRRMQSINAGFQSLRLLLPKDGEKVSKAAILNSTAQHIANLESVKRELMDKCDRLQRQLQLQQTDSDSGSGIESPKPKRRKAGSEIQLLVKDESEEVRNLKKQVCHLNQRLEQEIAKKNEMQIRLEDYERHEEKEVVDEDVNMRRETVVLPTETCIPNIKLEAECQAIERRSPVVLPRYSPPPHVSPPASPHIEPTLSPAQAALYDAASVSNKNILTICEAIYHLEGDERFDSESSEPKSFPSKGYSRLMEHEFSQHIRPGVIVSAHT